MCHMTDGVQHCVLFKIFSYNHSGLVGSSVSWVRSVNSGQTWTGTPLGPKLCYRRADDFYQISIMEPRFTSCHFLLATVGSSERESWIDRGTDGGYLCMCVLFPVLNT